MTHSYVEEREAGYWLAGTRISLDSIVYAFLEGQAPESIQRSFPLASLEQVYGAITYYLAHRSEIDAYLQKARADYEAARNSERAADPAFYAKMAKLRKQRVAER